MGEFYTASCFLGKGKQLVIRSGSPVSTLSDFRSKDAGGSHFLSRLSGRFIVWRTSDSHISLEEHSLNTNLHGNSLSVQIEGAPLLPSVVILETGGQVLILNCSVTTLTFMAFRFPAVVKTPSIPQKFATISLPSVFNEGLPCIQVQHNLPINQGTFPVAFAGVLLASKAVQVAISLSDGTILIGNLSAYNEDAPTWDTLRPNSGVKRVLTGFLTSFSRSENPAGETATDMVLLEPVPNDSFLATVSLDFKLRIWSLRRKDVRMCLDLATYLPESNAFSVALSSLDPCNRLRFVWNGEDLLLAVALVLESNFCFVVLKISNFSDLMSAPTLVTIFYAPAVNLELVDFCLSERQITSLYTGTVNETICYSASFDLAESISGDWKVVDTSSHLTLNNGAIVANSLSVTELCTLIFTPGRFSFSTVVKALKITCRGKGENLSTENWVELCAKAHRLINAEAQLVITEKRLTDEALSYVVQGVWQTFYSNCLQYHHAGSKPVGLLLQSESDMVGLIRQEFISFVCPKISSIPCEPTSEVIEKLLLEESDDCWLQFERIKWHNLTELVEGWIRDTRLSATVKQIALDLQRHSELLLPFISGVGENLQVQLDNISDQPDLMKASARPADLFCSTLGCELMTTVCQNCFNSAFRLLQSTGVLVCFAQLFKTTLSLTPETWRLVDEKCIPQLVDLSQNYAILCWFSALQVDEPIRDNVKLFGPKKASGVVEKPVYKFTSIFKKCLEGSVGLHARAFAVSSVNEAMEGDSFMLFPNSVCAVVAAVTEILWPANPALSIAEFLLHTDQQNLFLEYYKLAAGMPDVEVSLLYLKGSAHLHLGNPDAAVQSFMKASLGVESDCLLRKRLFGDSLETVCPSDYYLKVIEMFEMFSYSDHVLSLAQSCLAVCSDADIHNKPVLWTILFKNYLRLGRVMEAFDAIKRNPNSDSQRNCLRQAVVVFAENRHLHQLIPIEYGRLEPHIIDIMESRARTADLLSNDYYDFLFSFFISRKNYRKAAVCMYECALRLRLEVPGLASLRRQMECYTACISALSQASDNYTWIVKPELTTQQPGMSPKRDSDGTELNSFTLGKKLVVVTLTDIRSEYLLVKARSRLAEKNVALIGGFSSAREIVTALLQEDQFDLAVLVSKAYELSYQPVFEALTKKCVSCSNASCEAVDDKEKRLLFIWLDDNRMIRHANSFSASSTDDAWLMLEAYLDQFASRDPAVYRCVTNLILSMDFTLPTWLIAKYQMIDMPEVLRLLIEFGQLTDAHDLLIQQIDAISLELRSQKQSGAKINSLCWLPYNSIDLLLQVLDDNKTKSDNLQLFTGLESKLSRYFELIESITV